MYRDLGLTPKLFLEGLDMYNNKNMGYFVHLRWTRTHPQSLDYLSLFICGHDLALATSLFAFDVLVRRFQRRMRENTQPTVMTSVNHIDGTQAAHTTSTSTASVVITNCTRYVGPVIKSGLLYLARRREDGVG